MSYKIDLSPIFRDLDICTRDVKSAIQISSERVGKQMVDYAKTPDGPVVRRWRKGRLVEVQATRGLWAPDTGTLQGAFDHQIQDRPGRLILWLRAMVNYAWYLEQREGFSVVSHVVEAFKDKIYKDLAEVVDNTFKR